MKMQSTLNTPRSLCPYVVATSRRRFHKQHESCKRLRQTRAQVATQKLHTSVRAVEERSSPLFPAVRSTNVSNWIAACTGLQVMCLVAVLGIQVALLLERLQTVRTAAAAPDQNAAPSSPALCKTIGSSSLPPLPCPPGLPQDWLRISLFCLRWRWQQHS